ncbi:hypothetical protein CRENBAI_008975 [Crenichthys baileyi]|uniref:Uncharacterized protein n=1 Tax=Crenichthys baileyi TaxID=28760 RepID=A0AAV9R243_9TELE
MQAPGQHRHMHSPLDKQTKITRASQPVNLTLRHTTPPTTVPKGKTTAQPTDGATRGHSMSSRKAPRCRTTNIQASQAKTIEPSQATVFPEPTPQQHHTSFRTSTTNPKNTPPTRNHPADNQTLPQYKAKKPDATAEPSNARHAAPTLGGQSRCTQDHRPNTTLSKSKAPTKRRLTEFRPKNMPNTHTPGRRSPMRKPTPKPTEGRELKEPKPKPTEKLRPVNPKIAPGQPAHPPKPCRPH